MVSIDDEEKLKNLWAKTFDIRDRGTSIGEYFERFPHLKAPFGEKLVSKYSYCYRYFQVFKSQIFLFYNIF